jgi:hypothetical protein
VALELDPIAIAGEWIRHAPHRSDLPGRGPEPHRWRWQRGEPVRGLYLADEPDTAIAGRYRYLVERGLPPSAAIPHDHHLWHIDTTLADLSTEERLAAVGLHTHGPPAATGRHTRTSARHSGVMAGAAYSHPAPHDPPPRPTIAACQGRAASAWQ